MTITLVAVTHNRPDAVELMRQQWCRAGRAPDESIVVDNGSTDPEMLPALKSLNATTLVLNRDNLYYEKAFNAACRLARSEWICNSGSPDHSGPEGWLNAMCEVTEADSRIDGVSIYTCDPMKAPERIRGPNAMYCNGHRVIPGILFEVFMFRRSLLNRVGYYREDIGPYAWSDVEYFERTDREHAYLVAMLDWQMKRNRDKLKPFPEYDAWKDQHRHSPQRQVRMAAIRAQGNPKFDPWNGI